MWAATAGLSLVAPGAGHALVGRWRTGAIWFVACVASIVAIAFTVWAVPAALVLRLAALIDAARLGKLGVGKTWWMVFAFVAGTIAASIGVRARLAEAFRIPSSSMTPTLLVGDHIFVNKLGAVGRGDLIVFHTPCMPDRDYVERVVAVAGDTVEMRCSVLYLNGKAVPHELIDGDATYDDLDESTGRWLKKPARRFHETFEGKTYDVLHMSGDGSPGHDFPRDARVPSCQSSDYPELGREVMAQPEGKIVTLSPEPDDPCAPRAHFVVPAGGLFGLGDNRDNANDSRYWGVIPMAAVVGRVTGNWYSKGPDGMRWSRFGSVR